MQADMNGDGEVDFEEFMKHFPRVLDTIQLTKNLHENYLDAMSQEMKNNFDSTDLKGVGNQVQKEIAELNKK